MRTTSFASNATSTLGLALCLALSACNGGGGSDDSTGASETSADASTTGDPTTGDPTTGVDASTTTDDPTTGDSADTTAGSDATTGEPVDAHWGALVRGTLFTDDLDMAQGVHDPLAMGGERAATALGDYGHDALLGTTLLGTTENQFLAIDQWDDLEGAQTLYGDPDFQAGFGMLFARPPTLELLQRREDWYGWGDLEAGDGAAQHWFVVVRGRLAQADLDAMQQMHDGLAMGGEAAATAAGDVAHVVWVGTPDDPQQFWAVDVWTDDAAIEAFYGDPTFQMAFGALFEAPPTIGVYASTDWYQW